MDKCPTNTSVIPDNTPLECSEYISTKCIIHPTALSYLSLPANSTQFDINSNLVLALINANNKIIQLQNGTGGFTDKQLDVDGTYELQDSDDKKFIYVNSSVNTPKIALGNSLPDGFQCYIFYRADFDNELTERLTIDYNFVSNPLFTVPSEFPSLGNPGNIQDSLALNGMVHIVKRNSNLYTANGDLYSYGS